VEFHPPGTDPAAPWRSFAELTGPASALPGRIAAVRAALASRGGRPLEAIEPRVAASVTHLGLIARFVAPVLAAAACGYRLARPAAGLWWQDTTGGPLPLSVPEPDDPESGPGPEPGEVAGQLIGELITPITSAVTGVIPVPARVLWGNVASAVNGAAVQISAPRPGADHAVWRIASEVFGHPALSQETGPPGRGFRRSSCCLIYRIAPGRAQGVCGDCILSRPRLPPRSDHENG
jgi:hypothetical protein